MVQQLFGNRPGVPQLAVEVRLTHIACAMVQAGAGVAIVDELAVIGRVWPDVVVRPIHPTTMMPVNVIHYRLEPLSRLAQDFIDMLAAMKYHSLHSISSI